MAATLLATTLLPLPSSVGAGLPGCTSNDAATLEICVSSPPTHGGHDGTVFRRVDQLFAQAGTGDTIRIAMFRWDLATPADDLIAAQTRGAEVQIVADHDVLTNSVGAHLLHTIEKTDTAHRNVVVCSRSCLPWSGRAPAPPAQNVNHLKLFLFDIGGERSVAVTSANLEHRQYPQYNNLLRVTDDGFYTYALDYFHRLRAQRWAGWGDADKVSSGMPRAMVYPTEHDRVLRTLRSVRCVAGMRRVDVDVAVIQRAAVRSELGRLQSAGCRVRIVVTRERVENWLQARVRLSDGLVVNLVNARVRTALLHDKIITIHALVGGREKYVVLAGTSNLTCGGLLYNDEMIVRLDDRWAYLTYERHFADVYAHAHQSPNPGDVPHQRACHPR